MFDYLPDAEQALIDKLTAAYPDLPIGTREPAGSTTAWVRLFRIDGTDNTYGATGQHTFEIESWHRNRESIAATTAMDIRHTLQAWGFNRGQRLVNGGHTARIRAASASMPVSLPDPDGRARYRFTVTFTLRN